jgi:hypothetical protein
VAVVSFLQHYAEVVVSVVLSHFFVQRSMMARPTMRQRKNSNTPRKDQNCRAFIVSSEVRAQTTGRWDERALARTNRLTSGHACRSADLEARH